MGGGGTRIWQVSNPVEPMPRKRPGTGRLPKLYAAIFGHMGLLLVITYFILTQL